MLSRKNLDLLSGQFAVWGEGLVGEGTFFFPSVGRTDGFAMKTIYSLGIVLSSFFFPSKLHGR